MKSWVAVLKHAFKDFGADRCSEHAAALSYYTIFSIPPLLMLFLMGLGLFMDPQQLQTTIQSQAGGFMGAQGASAIQTIIRSAHRPDIQKPLTAIVGFAGILLGALGFFLSLQSALNRAWDVAPDPRKGGIKSFLGQRLLSFLMVLIVAAILVALVVAGALISAFSGLVGGYMSPVLGEVLMQAVNFVVSLGVMTVLFALLFKLLPDAYIDWHDTWVGAFTTAVLFVIGKLLIGLYLGHSNPGTAFGAAGSMLLLLVWIYYSAMILLFGAELTQAYAVERGAGVRPKRGAVRIVEARAPNELANHPDGAEAPQHAEHDSDVRPDEGGGRAAD